MKRKKMTPKQRVLRKWPKAISESYGMAGFQIVSVGPYAVATQLGQGRNRKTAWSDAARRLP